MTQLDPEFQNLLNKLRTADPIALQEFVDKYEPFLRRTIRYRIDRVGLQAAFDSKDVCQSVFGSFLLRYLAGDFVLESEDAARNLLLAMTNKKFLMFQRREYAEKRDRRRTTHFSDTEPKDERQPNPNDLLSHQEIVQRFANSLTADERQLYELRQAGLEWEEIGQQLQQSPISIRQKLSRAARRVAIELGIGDE